MSDQVTAVRNVVAEVELPVVEGFKGSRNKATVGGVDYMQVVYASIELNMHPQYVAKLCKEGDIEAVRDEQKRIWISVASVEAYKAQRAAEPKRVPGVRKPQKHVYIYMPQRIKYLKAAIRIVVAATDDDLDPTSKNDVLAYLRGLLEVDLKAHLENQAKKATGPAEPAEAGDASDASDPSADSDFQSLIAEP